MITAVVLITAEKGALPKLGEALAAIDGVSEVYSVTGDFDSWRWSARASTTSSPTS